MTDQPSPYQQQPPAGGYPGYGQAGPPPGGYPGYGQGAPGQGGYGQGGYGGPGGPGGFGQQQLPSGMATASLVLGIIGLLISWLVVGGLLGVLAVVFGFIARGKAKKNTGSGGGKAVAGIVTGFIAVAVAVVVLIFVLSHKDELSRLTDCLDQAGNDKVAQQQCQDQFSNDLGS